MLGPRLYPPWRKLASHLSGRDVGGVGSMMELSVELPRVEVQDELLQLSRDAERVDTKVTCRRSSDPRQAPSRPHKGPLSHRRPSTLLRFFWHSRGWVRRNRSEGIPAALPAANEDTRPCTRPGKHVHPRHTRLPAVCQSRVKTDTHARSNTHALTRAAHAALTELRALRYMQWWCDAISWWRAGQSSGLLSIWSEPDWATGKGGGLVVGDRINKVQLD